MINVMLRCCKVQKQYTNYIKIFLCVDFLFNIIILVCIAFIIYETNKYMYFGGFGSLFMLILLIPYFVILFSNILLLLLAIKFKKRVTIIIVLVLQMICSLLWILIMHLFQSTISCLEFMMILQIITTITILLLLWENRGI